MPETTMEMPATPAEVPTTAPAEAGDETMSVQSGSVDNDTIAKRFRSRADAAKKQTEALRNDWILNVSQRMGMAMPAYLVGADGFINDEAGRAEINPDWSLAKTKIANLFSQVPTITLTHEREDYKPLLPPFQKALNYELGIKRADIGTALDEALADIVNAAGVGAVFVGYEARFVTKPSPNVDLSTIPAAQIPAMHSTGAIQLVPTKQQTSYRFFTERVAPEDLLWPKEFTGSNFDDADWVGRRGRKPWSMVKEAFQLDDADKENVVGGSMRDKTLKQENEDSTDAELVHFVELYYWRARVDPDEPCLSCIWKLVFVDGKTDPVIHEAWTGQQLADPNNYTYVGACKFPIRIATLTYVSDHPVPPSDTAAGRPQVNDLRRSRRQMFANRDRSAPMRWVNTNLVDQFFLDRLTDGTFQGVLPVQGDGSRALGEVARASYPAEDMAFDRQTKADLNEAWQLGPNQMGQISSGEKPTKGEAEITQGNFATVIGKERNRIARFFLGAVEVLAGLMALYSDFPMLTDQERQPMETFKHVLHDLVFSILPDSTIVLDANDKMNRLSRLLNLTAKSGFINAMPIIIEMVQLSGLDPNQIVTPPKPQGPPPPSMSFAFKGDDIADPVVMAMLIKNGEAPDPQHVQAAKMLLTSAQQPIQPPPAGPQGALPPGGSLPPAGTMNPAVPPVAHPEWNQGSTIIKRQETGE